MALRALQSFDVAVPDSRLPFHSLPDIQIWTTETASPSSTAASSSSSAHMNAVVANVATTLRLRCFVNTLDTPHELVLDPAAAPYRAFTANKQSQGFLAEVLRHSEFKSGIGSVSFIVDVLNEDTETIKDNVPVDKTSNNGNGDNNNDSNNSGEKFYSLGLLCYFQNRHDEVSLLALPLKLNKSLCDYIDSEHADTAASTTYKSLRSHLQKLATSVPQKYSLKEDKERDKRSDIIDQVLKTKTEHKSKLHSLLRSSSQISLHRSSSTISLSGSGPFPGPADQSKIKLTIQRVILSGLRLRGITKASTEYKELYYHTFKSVEFAFRGPIRRGTVPLVDTLQDSVDTLLNLYLSEGNANGTGNESGQRSLKE